MISSSFKYSARTFFQLCVCFWLLAILPVLPGATLQSLYSFPAAPIYTRASLIRGSDGNFYGTTVSGGSRGGNYGGYGTVFKMTTNGMVTTLASFANTDGAAPYGGLVQGSDGNFYGTTREGGNGAGYFGKGTVFRVTTNGVVTTFYSFSTTDGSNGKHPEAGLVEGSDGNFYGTTTMGGPFDDGYGHNSHGVVFRVTTNGTFTIVAPFANTNGANPSGALVQGGDGNFYGTTQNGGSFDYGTVFMVTTNGTLTALASFNGTNGANPYGGLIEGSDGNFYGTTPNGGDYGKGTAFQVTTNGVLTALASFNGANGANPYAGLFEGSDGALYGTTLSGGANSNAYLQSENAWFNGCGSVFRVTTNGALSLLHSFGAITNALGLPLDGAHPYGGLIQGDDGDLYGATYDGGTCGYGTLFKPNPCS